MSRAPEYDALLAPYAVLHGSGLGRVHDEPEDALRLRFQRDRGRIVHTEAFRRLKGKTQVFVGGGGDHFRTRLTHTLEVAGVSRDLARALHLNEDLAECIALAHDLGHPPFGHAGEASLDEWMQARGSSFEHNVQSHRIVTALENHTKEYEGLNLNQEVLEGLLKHRTPHDHPDVDAVVRNPSLEAQLVNIADEIAYTAHDCEDGLNAELFSLIEVIRLPLILQAHTAREKRGTSLRGAIIHTLVSDLIEATQERLSSQRSNTLEAVYENPESVVLFSENVRTQLDAVRKFLWEHMYQHPMVLERSVAGQKIIVALCDHYEKQPPEKVTAKQAKTGASLAECIKDYVSGMTDGYAFLQSEKEGLIDQSVSDLLG